MNFFQQILHSSFSGFKYFSRWSFKLLLFAYSRPQKSNLNLLWKLLWIFKSLLVKKDFKQMSQTIFNPCFFNSCNFKWDRFLLNFFLTFFQGLGIGSFSWYRIPDTSSHFSAAIPIPDTSSLGYRIPDTRNRYLELWYRIPDTRYLCSHKINLMIISEKSWDKC